MYKSPQVEAARDQMARVLSALSQVDNKISLLLVIDFGMLALLAINMVPLRSLEIYMILIAVISVYFIAASFWHLYRAFFAKLEGSGKSFIHFREITERPMSRYMEEFREQTEEQYLEDLLEQVWRNSVVLKGKLDHLRWAFGNLVIAILPWLISLMLLTGKNAATKSIPLP
jgi:hypothetical protein